MAEQVGAMLEFHNRGVPTFDYGNNIRQMAKDEGLVSAFDFPGFVPAYIRPLFCRGIGPFRWVALSGDPEDIYRTDEKVKHAHAGRQAPAQLARAGPFKDQVSRAARAHLLGWPGRPASAGRGLQRDGCQRGAQSADRDWPRPSRFRLGRLTEPRDRSDEGRFRRRVGLADSECAAQLRVRRDVGFVPPRRGRWNGLLATRGPGDRG